MINKVGILSDESMDRLGFASSRFEEHYDPQNRFHNYDAHPMGEVFPTAFRLGAACLARGLKVNMVQLLTGAMGHDADSTLPLIGDYYATVEDRSGDISADIILRSGFTLADAVGAREIIVTTHRPTPYTNIEGSLLGLSDVSNLAGPYDAVINRAIDLWDEYVRLGKFKPNEFADWLACTPGILGELCFKQLVPELYHVPEVIEQLRAMEMNVEAIKQETPETLAAKLPHRLTAGAVLL